MAIHGCQGQAPPVGLDAHCYFKPHLQGAIAGTLTAKDLGVASTHSGNTDTIVQTQRFARAAGAAYIANCAGSQIMTISHDGVLMTASK